MDRDEKRIDQIKGGIYGMLTGDAVGVPYEFHRAEEIPEEALIDMVPPAGFHRAHSGVPCGTWSDDGAQALCLLDSLLEKERFDLKDFSDKLADWWYRGYRAVDENVFDIGIQTSQALMAYAAGMAPEKCGMLNPNGKGNGALMRVLPMALWHQGSDAELIRDSHGQCMITHGAVTNQVCCAFYCLAAREMLSGQEPGEAIQSAAGKLKGFYEADSLWAEYLHDLERILQHEPWDGHGSGYVVDSLVSAFMLMERTKGYQETIRQAIALGDDTDTTACIVGGLAGIYWGYSGIPKEWLDGLRAKETVVDAVEMLLKQSQ